VPVRGTNVACFRAGSGPVPPLVLLHGGGLDSARTAWAPLWHDLVVGGPVLAPDLPGFGATALGDTSPTIAGYRDWLLALLDALAVDRCVLVGLSLGGAVAAQGRTRRTSPDRRAGAARTLWTQPPYPWWAARLGQRAPARRDHGQLCGAAAQPECTAP
jgi:2-hydroxymuconate-semialdehyde hydrolase